MIERSDCVVGLFFVGRIQGTGSCHELLAIEPILVPLGWLLVKGPLRCSSRGVEPWGSLRILEGKIGEANRED